MTAVEMAGVALAGLNCVLALVLAGVYWRNHQQLRSPFTLGLLLFAAFLLLHNGVVVYHAFTMMGTGQSETLLLGEEILQTLAVGALVAATMR